MSTIKFTANFILGAALLTSCKTAQNSKAQSHEPLSDSEFKARVMELVKSRPCVESATYKNETIDITVKGNHEGYSTSCAMGLTQMGPFLEVTKISGDKITALFPKLSAKNMFFKAFDDIECVEKASMIDDGYIVKIKENVDVEACLHGMNRHADFKKLPDGTYQIGPRLFGVGCKDQKTNIAIKSYTDLRTATDRSSLLQIATHGEVILAPEAKPIVLNHCEGAMDMRLDLRCSSQESNTEFTIVQTGMMSIEVTLKQGKKTTNLECRHPLSE